MSHEYVKKIDSCWLFASCPLHSEPYNHFGGPLITPLQEKLFKVQQAIWSCNSNYFPTWREHWKWAGKVMSRRSASEQKSWYHHTRQSRKKLRESRILHSWTVWHILPFLAGNRNFSVWLHIFWFLQLLFYLSILLQQWVRSWIVRWLHMLRYDKQRSVS